MSLSEQTAREVSKYVKALVRRQPHWLRELFNSERIVFNLEPDDSLSLAVDESLEPEKKLNASRLITSYIEKHPCKFISITKVH